MKGRTDRYTIAVCTKKISGTSVMQEVKGYHAHVYFDADTLDQAATLCSEAGKTFPVTVGTIHRMPVGPHPRWSCQLAFEPERFGDIVPWLSFNRRGLTIFIHSLTGDDLKDHTDHAIWMGQKEELKLSVFS